MLGHLTRISCLCRVQVSVIVGCCAHHVIDKPMAAPVCTNGPCYGWRIEAHIFFDSRSRKKASHESHLRECTYLILIRRLVTLGDIVWNCGIFLLFLVISHRGQDPANPTPTAVKAEFLPWTHAPGQKLLSGIDKLSKLSTLESSNLRSGTSTVPSTGVRTC